MFVTFQYKGLHHLDDNYILTIEANQVSILIADIWNYKLHVYIISIVLNDRNRTESKYP